MSFIAHAVIAADFCHLMCKQTCYKGHRISNRLNPIQRAYWFSDEHPIWTFLKIRRGVANTIKSQEQDCFEVRPPTCLLHMMANRIRWQFIFSLWKRKLTKFQVDWNIFWVGGVHCKRISHYKCHVYTPETISYKLRSCSDDLSLGTLN